MIAVRVYGRSIPLDPRFWWGVLRGEYERTPRALRLWFGLLVGLMLIGAIGALRAVWPGDKGIATTPTVEWGLLIVGYVFFAITTSGLCLASSLGTVFGIDRFRPLEKRHAVLAVLCLVSAFGIIVLDLHFPIRLVFGAMFSPAPTSPMWWMGVFYGAYLCFLLVELWSIFWHHARIHQWACLLSSITAVLAPATLGAVFAVLAARPLWHGLFTPLAMVATAFVAGVSLLAVCFYVVGRLRLDGWQRARSHAQPAVGGLLLVGLLVVGLLLARQLLAGVASTDAELHASTMALLVGPLAPAFIGIRLIGGLALPLVLLLLPVTRTGGGLFAAGSLAIVGVFVDRLAFVQAGQMAPASTVSGVVSTPYAAYFPSLVEISIIVGAVGFVGFMYTLAERYLDLRESEAHTLIWLPAGLTTRLGEAWRRRRPAQNEAASEPAAMAESIEPAAEAEPTAMPDGVGPAVTHEVEPETVALADAGPGPEAVIVVTPEPDLGPVDAEPEPADVECEADQPSAETPLAERGESAEP